MKIRSHEELDFYKLAFSSAMKIFELTKSFPIEEKYSLTDQIRRSSRSVCSNLAALWNKMQIYYVYILRSLKDGKFYTGYTADIERRLSEHIDGKVISTKFRRPLALVYYEVSFNKKDALHRESYLKTTYGKRYIKNRLRYFIESNPINIS